MSSNQKRSHSTRDYESPYSFKILKEAAYTPQTLDEFNQLKENLKKQKKINEYLFILNSDRHYPKKENSRSH